ncbi:hypothetical protein ACK3YO_17910, partial [Aeromonas caviae]
LMMNPVPWLQMTNMISYQGLVRTFLSEHHIFRWMCLPGEAVEGDVPMSICLGSDDPGIFAADLKSEFYHLFVVLTRKFGLSPAEALRKVAEVNENGRIYRFHDVR